MNLENKIFVQINDDLYKSSDGYQLEREPDDWVLRSPDKSFIDSCQYRHDLAEKHKFKLKNNHS